MPLLDRTIVLSPASRLRRILLAAGSTVAIMALFLWRPEQLPLSSCALHDMTGYSCLTCGLSRSLHAMTQGDILASFRYHLMGPVVLLGMAAAVVVWAMEGLLGKGVRSAPGSRTRRVAIGIFLSAWVLYSAGRLLTELPL